LPDSFPVGGRGPDLDQELGDVPDALAELLCGGIVVEELAVVAQLGVRRGRSSDRVVRPALRPSRWPARILGLVARSRCGCAARAQHVLP